jgi:hypothetical protein
VLHTFVLFGHFGFRKSVISQQLSVVEKKIFKNPIYVIMLSLGGGKNQYQGYPENFLQLSFFFLT